MIRLLLINLLATTLLLIGTSSASAITINATSNYDGVSVLAVSDTITIVVRLDTGPQLDLQIVDIGMQFDNTILQYDDAASSMSSYLLYTPGSMGTGPSRWLKPLPNYINTVLPDASPKVFPVAPFDLVTFGYQEQAFAGTNITSADAIGQIFADVLATIVFHVVAVGDGLGEINLVMASPNRVQLSDGTILDGSTVLNGSFGVITPEPTTALLVGLGLAGLGVVSRRRAA